MDQRVKDIELEMQVQSKMLKRIETAVCGDIAMGNEGMAVAIIKLLKWRSSIRRQIAYVMGAIAATWFFVSLLAYVGYEWVKIIMDGRK